MANCYRSTTATVIYGSTSRNEIKKRILSLLALHTLICLWSAIYCETTRVISHWSVQGCTANGSANWMDHKAQTMVQCQWTKQEKCQNIYLHSPQCVHPSFSARSYVICVMKCIVLRLPCKFQFVKEGFFLLPCFYSCPFCSDSALKKFYYVNKHLLIVSCPFGTFRLQQP
jgi:hypothetical protein